MRPVRTILFPLAAYSPEWVSLRWALKAKRVARFMDLPAATFIAMGQRREEELARKREEAQGKEAREGDDDEGPEEPVEETDTSRYLDDPYTAIAKLSGDPDHDTWWERQFEHLLEPESYRDSALEFGKQLREVEGDSRGDREETLIREAYMRRSIRQVLAEGHDPSRVVVVCGAFHASVLTEALEPMSDQDAQALPSVSAVQTMMPYSYLRLSSQAGYGAGNKAPRYFQLLWEDLVENKSTQRLPARFLSEVAVELRKRGQIRSSAEIIEAVRLAEGVASMRDGQTRPVLRDLCDAAMTLLGQGASEVVQRPLDQVCIGDAIGSVPDGVMQTSLQEDFHHQIKDLKLDAYLVDKKEKQVIKGAKGDPWLDLRRDRYAKTPANELLDLNRSIFLHRMVLLGIDFATDTTTESQRETSTYKEIWSASWTPGCEMALAENSLRGDSVEIASVNAMAEKIGACTTTADAATLVRQAVKCELPDATKAASSKLQALAISEGNLVAAAAADRELADLICGKEDLRVARIFHQEKEKAKSPLLLIPSEEEQVRQELARQLVDVTEQLFLRSVILLPGAVHCDDNAAREVATAMNDLYRVSSYGTEHFPGINVERFFQALLEVAEVGGSHPYLEGVACALLMESGQLSEDQLERVTSQRLSPGNDPENGAQFFEGLASRNRYALLARKDLWARLSSFIEDLDDGAFRRSVVALRRAFASFEDGEARRAGSA